MKRPKNAVGVSLWVNQLSEDDNPEDVSLIWLKRNDERESYLITWEGEPFGDQCWIRAKNDEHSLVELDDIL